MKTITDTLKVSRSNQWNRKKNPQKPKLKYGQYLSDADILIEIREIISCRMSYGYRRIAAILNRRKKSAGDKLINHKKIYRIMRANHLLLQKATAKPTYNHDGKIITPKSNMRWCSDGFEIKCDNGEKVRAAFSLDCCDREIISFVSTNQGISGEMVRDLIAESVEKRFGKINKLNQPLEWLTDNGSCYVAGQTVLFAKNLGMTVCTTNYCSPESNGMAESFVKTFKRDYVQWGDLSCADAVFKQLPAWFEDYNNYHPHQGLNMLSPKEYIKQINLA